MRNPKSVLWAIFLGLVFLSPFLLSACGKKDNTRLSGPLSVKIVNVAGNIHEKELMDAIGDYATTVPKATIRCSTEEVTPGIPLADLEKKITNADVVIFPSLLNPQFRSLAAEFSPQSATRAVWPPVLSHAYAGSSNETVWALPFALDPMVLVVKKDNQGGNPLPTDWMTVKMLADVRNRPLPYLVFLTSNKQELADSVAAQQLAFGYLSRAIHKNPAQSELTEQEKKEELQRAWTNMKQFICKESDEKLTQLPVLPDMQAFMDSKAYCTISRMSSAQQLPGSVRQKMDILPLFSPSTQASPAYAVAIAISIKSGNPVLSENLISYILSHAQIFADGQYGLPAFLEPSSLNGLGPFERDAAFLPREIMTGLSEKELLDALNGDLPIDELNQRWQTSFSYPETNFQ